MVEPRVIRLPALPEPALAGGGLLLGLLTTGGSLGMVGFVASAAPWIVALVGLGVVAGLATAVARWRDGRRRVRAVQERRDRWVDLARAAVAEVAMGVEVLRTELLAAHPSLDRVPTSDGWAVRTGLGTVDAPVTVDVAAADPLSPPDPVVAGALSGLVTVVDGVPLVHELVPGEPLVLSRAQARRAVAELALSRDPSSWALVVAVGEGWDGLVWLPPAWDPERPGSVRGAADLPGLRALLAQAPPERLVLLDGPAAAWAADLAAERVLVVAEELRGAGLAGADLRRIARLLAPRHGDHRSRSLRLAALSQEVPALQPLCVPIGRLGDGAVLTLDLREAAAGGQGPHGLVVGATGSGKSELLRALVLQLVDRHPPDELALLLIDHKGGATFAGLAGLPHVAGLATNLADGPAQARLRLALAGELDRRQRLLRDAGRDSIDGLAPHLVVVVDEFGELLEADPDLLALLVRVGRLGRSLGLHLVLATQRLEEGRLRGLDAHLRWRVCLRTFSESESRAAIGVPDAARLPPVPGPGLLKVDDRLQRFSAAWAGGPAHLPGPPPVQPLVLVPAAPELHGETEREALVAAVIARGQAQTAPVCLPPLRPRIAGSPAGAVAQLDLPAEQAQPWVAPAWELGHLALVGAPRSGRTSTLLACAQGLLEAEPDARLVLLGADLEHGPWASAPAVWAAAGRDLEHLRDVARACVSVLERPPGEPPLLVLVDGVAALRPEVGAELALLAERGPSRGVHLALAAHRWSDLGALRDLVTQRWELALADPLDSHHGPAAAALLRSAPPGRLLDPAGRLGQVVLPCPPPLRAPARGVLPAPADVLRALPAEAPVLPAHQLGVRAGDHAPVAWDPAQGPLLIVGGPGSGRTTVLERLAHADPGLALLDDSERQPGAVAELLQQGRGLAVVRSVATSGRAAWDPDLLLLRERAAAAVVLSGDPLEGPVFLGVGARPGPPGRGTWVRRGHPPVAVRLAAPGPHLKAVA